MRSDRQHPRRRTSDWAPASWIRPSPLRCHIYTLLVYGGIVSAFGASALAQSVEITAIQQNGLLAWSNTVIDATSRVEWASSPGGPWTNSWNALRWVKSGTNGQTSVMVPMFYRVMSPALIPDFVDVSATAAGSLVITNQANPDFVIMDIRTPSEYASGHIVGAVNVDFYGNTFSNTLAVFNRDNRYLVYCRSGGRSGATMTTMRALNFATVYNVLGGFDAFELVPGNGPLIE